MAKPKRFDSQEEIDQVFTDGCAVHMLDWDVVIQERILEPSSDSECFHNGIYWCKNTPYQAVIISEYFHSIGEGGYVWIYPRGEKPTLHNLLPFDGEPCLWGMNQWLWNDYNNTVVDSRSHVIITRNNIPFVKIDDVPRAIYILNKLRHNDHPLNLDSFDYDKAMIGRKVWVRDQKAIITSFIKGQACVILEPEDGKFVCPNEFKHDPVAWSDESEKRIKISIFSESIGWFR